MTNVDRASRKENIFRSAGTGNNPWKLGRAQSVIIKLVERGAFQVEVLDVGCGIEGTFNRNWLIYSEIFRQQMAEESNQSKMLFTKQQR